MEIYMVKEVPEGYCERTEGEYERKSEREREMMKVTEKNKHLWRKA